MTIPSTHPIGKSAKKEYHYTKADMEELRRVEEENRRLQMEIGSDGDDMNAFSYQPENEFNENFQFKQKSTQNQFGKTAPLKQNKEPFLQFGKKEDITPQNEIDTLLNEIEFPDKTKTTQDFFKRDNNATKKSSLFADLDNHEQALSQHSNLSKRPQTADVALKKQELFGIKTAAQPFQQASTNISPIVQFEPENIIEEAPLNIPSRRRQKGSTMKTGITRPKTAAAAVTDSRQSYEENNFLQPQQQEFNIQSQFIQSQQIPKEQSQIHSYSKQLSEFYEQRWTELYNNYQEQVKIIKENFNEEAKHLRSLNQNQLLNEKTEFEQEIIQLEEKFQQENKRMTEMQQFELTEKDKQFEEELQGLRKQNSEYEAMLQAYKNFKVGHQEIRDAVDKISLQDKRKLNIENYGENQSFAMKNIQLNEKERKIKAQEDANLKEKQIIQDLVTQLNQKEKEQLNYIATERKTLQEQYNSLNQIQQSFKASENKHKTEYESLKQNLDILKDDLNNQIQRIKSDYKILEKQYQLRVNKFENDKKKQNEMNQQLQSLINQRDQEIQQTLEELNMLENEITNLTKLLDLQEMELAHQEDQFVKQKNEQELNAVKIKNAAKSIKLQHSEVERKQKLLETKKNEVKLKQLQIETYLNTLQQQENELNSEKVAQQSQQQNLHEMRKTLMSSKTMPFSGNTDASATRSVAKMTEFERIDAPKSRMKTNQFQRISDSAKKSNYGTSFKKFDFENYKQELGLYENEIEGNSQYMNQSKQNVFNLNNQFTS